MPFAPFVGVNHHGQSVLFGCGLLSNENIETYIWLFKAVAQVFPESRHRLCLWHIMKKLPEKLGIFKNYDEIKKRMKSIVYESLTHGDFDTNWLQMVEEHGLLENAWLSSLFTDRLRWVPVYVKETFWTGMSTTQRSESMNAFFDDYVNSKTTLKQFVEQYDNALKSKVEKEEKADFHSINSIIPLLMEFYFEKQFQEAYTHDCYKLMYEEVFY
ncbi:Protein FAR1-RELATED SEQUENCE 5 [Acorus gramineus]|uniref:Protein FAR1-RELATED SEQUENCE n=1 Tax=Acorus gramineus TaxID=55184 RepID=A0AAV9BD63_ACOGR|nr:Protein FAR1-RELATED SEQUENCE 5 [Acorus gramineus]